MTTRLVGYQPQYFPRLHYYARFLNSDLYTISDYLQYVRKHIYINADGTKHRGVSYQAHTAIKTAQGVLLLDIPVQHSGDDGLQLMTEAKIDYSSAWREKHLENIAHHYKKAPYFNAIFPGLKLLFEKEYPNLAACTVASTLWGLAALFEVPILTAEAFSLAEINALLPFAGLRLKKVVPMSESDIPPPDKKTEYDTNQWIIEKCLKLGANEYYYGGTAASAYADFDRWKEAGISVLQQDWKCAEYPQQFPKIGFIPNLSIIDLLMNVSPAEARLILVTPHQ